MCFHNCSRHSESCKVSFLGQILSSAMGNVLCPGWDENKFYSDLIFLCFWVGCIPGCFNFTTIITGFRWSFHTLQPTSLADIVWMMRDRLQSFQRGKGFFTKAANTENILHTDVLSHRLNMLYMITYSTMKSEVGTTRWKTWSLYKGIKIWLNSCGVLAAHDCVSVQVSTKQAQNVLPYILLIKMRFQHKHCVFNKHLVDFQNSGLHTREVWFLR